jgi:hypothetical protein
MDVLQEPFCALYHPTIMTERPIFKWRHFHQRLRVGAIRQRFAQQGLGGIRGAHRRHETIHEIRKGQVRWLRNGDVRVANQFIERIFGLTA